MVLLVCGRKLRSEVLLQVLVLLLLLLQDTIHTGVESDEGLSSYQQSLMYSFSLSSRLDLASINR